MTSVRLFDSMGRRSEFEVPGLGGKPRTRPAFVADPSHRGEEIEGRDGSPAGRYGLLRALNALAEDRAPDGIEAEIGDGLRAYDRFREYRGFPVPFGVFGLEARSLDTSAGAGALGKIRDNSAWVEGLRNASVVTGFGARVVTGIRAAEMAYPRITTNSTVGWIGEGSDAPEAPTAVAGAVLMKPHCTGAYVDISRRFLKEGGPLVLGQVTADLRAAIGSAIDAAAIAGQVAVPQLEPIGALNTAGITTVDFAGPLSGVKMADLEDAIAEDRVVSGFVTTKAARKAARNTPRLAGGVEVPLWGDDGRVLGYPARASSNTPTGKAILGAWDDCLVGFWGNGVDVLIDPYTGGPTGRVRVIALVDVDIAFRHTASFAIGKNIA